MTDWVKQRLDEAIARNRQTLLRMVAALVLRAGLDEAGPDDPDTLPRHVWRTILSILLPAESAARRLIALAARDIEVTYKGPASDEQSEELKGGKDKRPASDGEKRPASRPIDTDVSIGATNARSHGGGPKAKLKNGIQGPTSDEQREELKGGTKNASLTFRLRETQIPSTYDLPDGPAWPGPFAPLPGDDPMPARFVRRRILALRDVLGDIPAAAQRYARLEARRAHALAHDPLDSPRRTPVLRIGHPPGWRRRPVHPVGGILEDCQSLLTGARYWYAPLPPWYRGPPPASAA